MEALNPALAAAMIGASDLRKLMYNLIWQSVMWRPGKVRFLIGVKNPLHTRPTATPSRRGPLGRIAPSLDSRLRSGYALPPSPTERPILILIDARLSP